MIFVKTNNLASAQLRADQIANKLGAQCFLNDLPENLEDETVIFVKDANSDLVFEAARQGARIVYDPIDTFAYPDRVRYKTWYGCVDTVICFNRKMADSLNRWFSEAAIIPHQWDARIEGTANMDMFRPVYIGYKFNWPSMVQTHGIQMICEPEVMLQAAPEFNCHVSIREPGSSQAMMKPATKVSIAAAVGAVCITTPDESMVELLPKEYPYWCMTVDSFPKILEKAKDEFNGPVWNRALEIMAEVKEKTSLNTISEKYKHL